MAYTTIDDPSAYFHTQLYSGDGGGSNAITNDANAGDFKPDWLWIKERTATSSNTLVDSTRGAGNILLSDNTNAEASAPAVSSLNTDGFTLGSDGKTNQVSQTYVAWQWKANGGSRTTFTESGNNPAGGYQANATAGFSIIDYTGTGAAGTVAHGLGATPKVVIIKGRTNTEHWIVATTQLDGSRDGLYLETTGAKFDLSSTNELIFDSTNITVSDDWVDTNADGQTYIMYAFAPIKGYSRFGMYRGNGSTDGTFVFTGFSPAWVLVRRTDSGNNWHLHDNQRVTSNPNNLTLYPNLQDGDASEDLDMLSNGFKLRESGGGYNADGGTYMYMAFAESPFTSSEGVPTTAK